MKNLKCRNCKKINLKHLFSLGDLFFTGKFGKYKNSKIPKGKITLVKCNDCNLVQLDRKFNPKILYGKDYGYRSGINPAMVKHLSEITGDIKKIVKFKKGDVALDIASNDGTLLKSYKSSNIRCIGIDPTISRFKNFYPKNFNISSTFFSKKNI